MGTLKNYQDQQDMKPISIEKYIKSGVKSPNSDREMLIVSPLERHPQIQTLYKAIDPGVKATKKGEKDEPIWIGWVELPAQIIENEAEVQSPTEEEKNLNNARIEYRDKMRVLKARKELASLGVDIGESQTDINLRKEIKKLAQVIGIL